MSVLQKKISLYVVFMSLSRDYEKSEVKELACSVLFCFFFRLASIEKLPSRPLFVIKWNGMERNAFSSFVLEEFFSKTL